MRNPNPERVRIVHRLAWLWEPLEADVTFELGSMFGTKVVFIGGRLVLCFATKEEPWRGLLVCTDRVHQESLMNDFPGISPHPVLPKWLYLPESHLRFERTAERLVEAVRQRDPRIGIVPGQKKRKR